MLEGLLYLRWFQACAFYGLGFRVEDFGIRVLGVGFWVWGLGTRVGGFGVHCLIGV